MVATIATDPTEPVSYYFAFNSSPTGGAGGADSNWQPSSTTFVDSDLQANHQYGYSVKAKDGNNNETSYSSPVIYTYTSIETPTGISFGTVTSNSIQAKSTNEPSGLARAGSGLIIENVISGTNSSWKQDNNYWDSSGLSANTQYEFKAKARNGDGDETPYSSVEYKYTLANVPTAADFSNVTVSSIQANWTANGNPAGTEYYCENTTNATNSGWITDTCWSCMGLDEYAPYLFRVKTRNGDGTDTDWQTLGSETTLHSDILPPTWAGAVWEYAPEALDCYNITMKVAVATDENEPVAYRFRISKSGGPVVITSQWRYGEIGRTYTACGLMPSTAYICEVQARDSLGNGGDDSDPWLGGDHPQVNTLALENSPQGVAKPVSGEMGNDLNLQIDPFTGNASYSIPIIVPPARQGAEPKISLNYNSGGGNSWCGVGWSLGMGTIQRDTKKGVPVKWDNGQVQGEYDDDKGFTVTFGSVNSRLVRIGIDSYRTETDKTFLKFEFERLYNRWVVTDKSGNKFYFGDTSAERMIHPQFDSGNGKNTFLWALGKIEDINGNITYLDYTTDCGGLYLDKISYNGNSSPIDTTHTVEFILEDEDRTDKSISYATGYRVETNKRLSDIKVKVVDDLVRRYHLSYVDSTSTARSILQSVTIYGSDDATSLPPLEFTYQEKSFEFDAPIEWGPLAQATDYLWGSVRSVYCGTRVDMVDMNGDGLPDRVMRNNTENMFDPDANPPGNVFKVQLNTGNGFETDEDSNPIMRDWSGIDSQGYESNDYYGLLWNSIRYRPLQESAVELTDLNGDGFPDRVMRRRLDNYDPPDKNYDATLGNNYFLMQMNNGFGFEASEAWGAIDSQENYDSDGWNSLRANDGPYPYGLTHADLIDMNGDGLLDRVMRWYEDDDYTAEGLVINEILPRSNWSNWCDFVEIYNASDFPIDVGGMYVTNNLNDPTHWQIPAGCTIPIHGYLIIHSGTGDSVTGGLIISGFGLYDSDGAVGLYDTDGETLIDSIEYGSMSENNTYGRAIDGCVIWQRLPDPTPEDENNGTPLVINELMFNNQSIIQDEYGEYDSWIEIFNAGDTAIDMSGMCLTPDFSQSCWWSFPAGTSIAAYGHLIVWVDGDSFLQGPLHTNFPLNYMSLGEIGLRRGGGDYIDKVEFPTLMSADISYARIYDGSLQWNSYSKPTPESKNRPNYNIYKVQFNTGNGFERTETGSAGGTDFVTSQWGPLDMTSAPSGMEQAYGSIRSTNTTSDTYIDFFDINGDGLPDRVMRKKDSPYDVFKVQFNTGYGFEMDEYNLAVLRDWGPVDGQDQTEASWCSTQGIVYGGFNADILDINGDGLPDRVMRKVSPPYDVFKVQLNTGTGFEKDTSELAVLRDWSGLHTDYEYLWNWNSTRATADETTYVDLMDINGDGLIDRVMREYGGSCDVLIVQLNKGSRPDLLKTVTGRLGGHAEITYTPSTSFDNHKDNNGLNRLPLSIQTVTSVTLHDGLGSVGTTIYDYYRGMYDFERREFMGFGKVEVTNSFGVKTITYFHQCGGYEDGENGENNDEGSIAKKGIPYRTEVYGNDGLLYGLTVNKVDEVEVQLGDGPDSDRGQYFPYISQITSISYEGLDYNPTYTGFPSAKGYTSDYIATIKQNEYYLDTGGIKKVTDLGEVRLDNGQGTSEEIHNQIFNNIAGHTYTSNVDENDDLYIHTEYVTDTAYIGENILNKIERSWTSSDPDGNNELKEVKFFYDQSGSVDYSGIRGNVTETQTWLKEEDRYISTFHTYDIYGNRTSSMDALGIKTTTVYDNIYKMYPVEVTTGQSGVTIDTVTSYTTYDVRSGQVITKTSDIGNVDAVYMVSRNVYDELYRLTDVYTSKEPEQGHNPLDSTSGANPSDPATLWVTQINYNLGGIIGTTSYNYVEQEFNGYYARTYNDGLGRVIQTRIMAEDDAVLDIDGITSYGYRVSDTHYDNHGRVDYQSIPHPDDGEAFDKHWTNYADTAGDTSGPGTRTEYDSIGRTIRVIPTEGDDDSPTAPSRTDYNIVQNSDPSIDSSYLRVTTTTTAESSDAESITKQYVNAKGQIVKLVEDPDELHVETRYGYDILGRLTTITDHSGNEISYVFDNMGRKLQSNDPDMGTWSYVYDDAGNLIEQTDARGNIIVMFYHDEATDLFDEIGRVLKKKIFNSSSQLKKEITFYYDSNYDPIAQDNDENYTVYKGNLFMSVEKDGQGQLLTWTKNGYDARGRTVKSTRYLAVNGEQYTTETGYDDADRVTVQTYPNGVASIYNQYDSVGNLISVESLSGTGPTEVFYQVYGFNEIGQMKQIEYGNGVTTEYEYYENSKRSKSIYTEAPDSTVLQDLTYTFDSVSNIKKIIDGQYSGTSSGGLSDAGGIEYDKLYRLKSLYSASKGVELTYTYDALGNVMTNGEYGSDTYDYSGSGHAHTQPHAVTGFNEAAQKYVYDTCGNMITRKSRGFGDQTLSYDEENRLVKVEIDEDRNGSIDRTIEFGYSDGGARLWKKVDGELANIWMGGLYEERNGRVLCHVAGPQGLAATFEPRTWIAGLIHNNPILAQGCQLANSAWTTMFRGGRTPITVTLITVLAALVCAFRYSRKRKRGQIQYSTYYHAQYHQFYMRSPFRQAIAAVLIAGMTLLGVPQLAYADSPQELPNLIYYHSDHLGSSSVITNGEANRTDGVELGDTVQHYVYTPFGDESYKLDTFENVSHRYTGQILDEDTGLYYYNARYYDTEIARFIQADTVFSVDPTATSQGLNRYAYCNNNPLKFTDPTGHFLGLSSILVSVIAGAILGGASSAAQGGDFWKGAGYGALSGLAGCIGGSIGGSLIGGTLGVSLGAAGAGALSAYVSGGDPLMSAITAGFTASIGFRLGSGHPPFLSDHYFGELIASTGVSALVGGTTAEIQGGNFWRGASDAAMWGAAGYVLSSVLNKDAGQNEEDTWWYKTKKLAKGFVQGIDSRLSGSKTWWDINPIQWVARGVWGSGKAIYGAGEGLYELANTPRLDRIKAAQAEDVSAEWQKQINRTILEIKHSVGKIVKGVPNTTITGRFSPSSVKLNDPKGLLIDGVKAQAKEVGKKAIEQH